MFELIGFSVVKLRRVRIGSLTDRKMKPGHWRLLAADEVKELLRKTLPKRRPLQAKPRRPSPASGRR